jgi:hypothetical protein
MRSDNFKCDIITSVSRSTRATFDVLSLSPHLTLPSFPIFSLKNIQNA